MTVSGYDLALLRREHHRREIFEIHLVHDSSVGRHDAEVVEGALPPSQKKVALLVAIELQFRVGREGVGGAERIDLHRMIDHQIDRLQRTDLVGIASELFDRIAHHGQIRHHRHAGEILEQYARRHERDFALAALAVPSRQSFDLTLRHDHAVLASQHVLDHHLDRVRHPREREPVLFERVELVDRVALAIDGERRTSTKTVCRHGFRIARERARSTVKKLSRRSAARRAPRCRAMQSVEHQRATVRMEAHRGEDSDPRRFERCDAIDRIDRDVRLQRHQSRDGRAEALVIDFARRRR